MALDDYPGYSRITERLSDAVRTGRVGHAYIIEGDTGTPKADFALDFAKAILCAEEPGRGCGRCRVCRSISDGNYEDLYRVSAEDGTSVKDKAIEELQAELMNVPSGLGGRNIAIIEDADTMTVRAQNRFLKTLEEPQPGTVIMLLSENSDNLLPTIRSRCIKLMLGSIDAGNSKIQSGKGAGAASEKARGGAAASTKAMRSLAESTLEMAEEGAYFYQIKAKADKIKDKKTALAYTDEAERVLRDKLLSGSDTGYAARGIELVEAARRDVLRGVAPKNAIKKFLLLMHTEDKA